MAWSKWIEPGFYINFVNLDGVREYHRIKRRSFAHIEWEFGFPDKANADRVVSPLTVQGPYIPGGTEVMMRSTSRRVLHQIIHGHKPACYVYREWPGEAKRHGFPRRVWNNADLREVAHFTMEMSPFRMPSFVTEFFLLKDILNTWDVSVYNPSDETPILPRFNFQAAKLELEPIGETSYQEQGIVQIPSKTFYKDTLDKLHRGILYSRPITFDFPKQLAS